MRSVNTISKVSPLEATGVKYNNFLYKSLSIINQIRYLIYIECVLGLNRFYLLQCNNFFLYATYLYATLIVLSTFYHIIASYVFKYATYAVIEEVMCLEYVFLMANALLTKKKKMQNYFKNLRQFDHTLRVSSDHEALSAKKKSLILVFLILIYNIAEFGVLLTILEFNFVFGYTTLFFYCVVSFGHDMEQVFFITLLRTIFTRLQLLKAHVRKIFSVNDERTCNKNPDKIETLSNNAQLDIGSLHKVYELLHKCSEQLNSIMSFPMLMILFTSGFGTTMLLKALVKIIQENETMDSRFLTIAVLYHVARAAKYTLLVIMPCYYSSVTSSQVASIRTMLYDSLNTIPLDKLERRRVKAFFLLTKESEFVYALAGLIRLNMTLPLSYASLCTTYLVIIIQFSKFLD